MEWLLISDGRPAPESPGVRLVGSYPPRLLVVESAVAPDGFRAVGPQDPIPPDLSEGERLFAAAWQQSKLPKSRDAEGLSWDAPGFQPPDDPKSS